MQHRLGRGAGWGAAWVLALTSVAAGVVAGAARAQAPAGVVGVVRTEDDEPVIGAHVTLLAQPAAGSPGAQRPAAMQAATSEDGAFRFGQVAGGWAQLTVRRLGFRPETLSVEVPQLGGGRLVIPLQQIPRLLSTVAVHASIARGPFAAFERRRQSGFGRFVTRADIERRRPQRTTDLMRAVPGVTVERNDFGVALPRFRNASVGFSSRACDPTFWLDGAPLGTSLDMDALNPGAIEGIELYSGAATVPAALRGGSSPGACGVVAIWTRQGAPRARRVTPPDAPAAVDALVTAGQAYTADQVDRPALPLSGGEPVPVYPDSLRSARVSGRVVAEFVVDEGGVTEEATISVVSATHPDFAEAVRAVLPGARFTPATRGGRRVRQVVHLPVVFDPSISIPRVVTAPSAPPSAPPIAPPGASPGASPGAPQGALREAPSTPR